MNKKWLIAFVVLLMLMVFWQTGGLNMILARTIFAPDYVTGNSEETPTEENQETVEEEPTVDETSIEHATDDEELIIVVENLQYAVEVIGEGLEVPWEILPLSDGRYLVTERQGRVVVLGSGDKYTIQGVESIGEGGLLGMAIGPEYEDNKHLFLYYTYRESNRILNRVSRFTLGENGPTDETIILNAIPGSRFHNGGRLKFGPDDKLYITTGDAQEPSLSQDIDSLAGKILRINPDGTVPEDNPFENSPVFAYGLRNPQGLSWHPISGELYASDHGPNSQDEINRILPGKNYGWPLATCQDGDTIYEDPVSCYSEFTLAPSGLAFLPWENLNVSPLYIAGLRGNMIMRIDLDDMGDFIRQEALFRDFGRIRTIVYHEGLFYVATNNRDGRGTPGENDDMIIKVTPQLPALE